MGVYVKLVYRTDQAEKVVAFRPDTTIKIVPLELIKL